MSGSPLARQQGEWSMPLARHPKVMPAQGAQIMRSVTCNWWLEPTNWMIGELVTNAIQSVGACVLRGIFFIGTDVMNSRYLLADSAF